MAVNLAKRRYEHLVAKEAYEAENAKALKEQAAKAIKDHKDAMKSHQDEQAKRVLELRGEVEVGAPVEEVELVPKTTQGLVAKKIEKKIIGHPEEPAVDEITDKIEPTMDGTLDVFNYGASTEPAQVIAEKAANEKPEQKAKANKAIPKNKKTKVQEKVEKTLEADKEGE